MRSFWKRLTSWVKPERRPPKRGPRASSDRSRGKITKTTALRAADARIAVTTMPRNCQVTPRPKTGWTGGTRLAGMPFDWARRRATARSRPAKSW